MTHSFIMIRKKSSSYYHFLSNDIYNIIYSSLCCVSFSTILSSVHSSYVNMYDVFALFINLLKKLILCFLQIFSDYRSILNNFFAPVSNTINTNTTSVKKDARVSIFFAYELTSKFSVYWFRHAASARSSSHTSFFLQSKTKYCPI